jgi:dipeptidyl aminopeptidase/acylaminoacyl peptidase
VDPQGGAPKRLASGFGFDLSPSGNAIYTTVELDSVLELDPETGARRRGFSLMPIATTVHSVAVSPDARWLAFIGVRGSVTFLGICHTDGSAPRRLIDDVPRNSSLGWSPEGEAIYYLRDLGNGANVDAAGDVMKLRVSSRTGEARGPPTVVLAGAYVQEFSLSSDGRQLAYTKAPPQQKLWTMTLEGPAQHPRVQARELSTGTSIHGTPDLSPDGKLIAFARNDGGAGNLYITPFDRYEPRVLVASPGDEWSPRWSPSGREIAFAGRDSTSRGILVADLGTGQVRRISRDGLAPLGVIAWLPNAREIVFPLDLGRHYAVQDVQTGRADTLAAPEGYEFHFTVPSPDGGHLAVDSYLIGGKRNRNDLWTVDRSGQPWKQYHLTGWGQYSFPLAWTRDGWIYLLSVRSALLRVRVEGGNASEVAVLPQPCSFWQTSMSADARRLVCTVSRSEPDVWLAENLVP